MTSLTQEQRKWLDKCAKGWTLNPKTGLVDVFGDFHCMSQGLKGFKGVKFGRVSNNFTYSNNRLTSLVGAPQSVGGCFYCDHNLLTSLEGSPQEVKGRFDCSYNLLSSLVGAPKKIGWRFYCQNNRLTSLEGAPQSVGCFTDFDNNPVSKKTLDAIFEKMKKCGSFVISAASLRNEMSEEDWKLISPHIPEAIRPGVNMLARFGVFK